ADGAGAVDDGDIAESLGILQGIPDGAADGGHGDSAADEDEVFPLPLLHGVAVAVRAAEADRIPFVNLPQRLGHLSRLAEAELEEIVPVRARADVEGRLARPEGRENAELT